MLSQALAVEKFENGSEEAKVVGGDVGVMVSISDSVALDAELAVSDDSVAAMGRGAGGKSSANTRVAFGARPSHGKMAFGRSLEIW